MGLSTGLVQSRPYQPMYVLTKKVNTFEYLIPSICLKSDSEQKSRYIFQGRDQFYDKQGEELYSL